LYPLRVLPLNWSSTMAHKVGESSPSDSSMGEGNLPFFS
jgi:hypothetical protein